MSPLEKFKQHTITAIKFVFLAVPGGFLLVIGLLMTVGELLFEGPNPNRLKNLLVFPMAAAAGFPVTLFGLGLWGQWRYAYVFISIPISVLIIGMLPLGGKFSVILALLPALVICWLVKDYYDKAA